MRPASFPPPRSSLPAPPTRPPSTCPPLPSPRLLHTFSCHSSITSVLFAPNGLHCFLSTSDRHIHVVNPTSSTTLRSFRPSHGYDVTDIAVSPDASTLYSVSTDRHCVVTAVERGEAVRKWKAHEQRVNCVRVGGGGQEGGVGGGGGELLLTGGDDGWMRVWDVRQRGKEVQGMKDAKDSVTGVAFLPHLPYTLCSASVDGALRMYDARRGQLSTQQVGHPLTAITPMKEGGALLLSSLSSTLFLFSTSPPPSPSTSPLLQFYQGASYVNAQYSLRPALVLGSSHVVSGTELGNGLVSWHVDSGRETGQWGAKEGHAGVGGKHAVSTSLDWSEEQRLLLSGSTDGDVRVWQM